MRYEATIEDPKVFTRPWKISMPVYRQKDMHWLPEYECEEELGEATGSFASRPAHVVPQTLRLCTSPPPPPPPPPHVSSPCWESRFLVAGTGDGPPIVAAQSPATKPDFDAGGRFTGWRTANPICRGISGPQSGAANFGLGEHAAAYGVSRRKRRHRRSRGRKAADARLGEGGTTESSEPGTRLRRSRGALFSKRPAARDVYGRVPDSAALRDSS